MIIRSILCCALACLANLGAAQDFDRSHSRYRDKFQFAMEPGERIERTWFHYTVSRLPDGHWTVRTFYPETGAMTALMTYKDKELGELDGPYSRWYDNGQLREQGRFSAGKRSGPWVSRQLNGAQQSGRYDKDRKQGLWESRDKDGNMLSSIPYLDGKRHGIGRQYGKEGLATDTLVYERDSLLNARASGPSTVERLPYLSSCDSVADEKQRFRCTEAFILGMLRKHLRYPAQAMDLEVTGLADFEFVIDQDGRMLEVLAKNALCRAIEEECRRVFGLLPEWRPGTQGGKPVKVAFNQPVRFKLQ
jgi:hypothetical protein